MVDTFPQLQHVFDAVRGCKRCSSLNLAGNNIVASEQGMSALIVLLQRTPHLRRLDLSRCRLSGASARLLAKQLTPPTPCRVSSLTLDYNPIGGQGCLAFAAVVERSHRLRSLSIHECGAGLESLAAFEEALRANECCVALDIRSRSATHLGRRYRVWCGM